MGDTDEDAWLRKKLSKRQRKNNRKKQSKANGSSPSHAGGNRDKRGERNDVGSTTTPTRSKRCDRGAGMSPATPQGARSRPRKVLKIYEAIRRNFDEWFVVESTVFRVLDSLENVVSRIEPIRRSFSGHSRSSALLPFEGLETSLLLKQATRIEKSRKQLGELMEQMKGILSEVETMAGDVFEAVEEFRLSGTKTEDVAPSLRTVERPVALQDYVEWSLNMTALMSEEYWRKRRLVEHANYDDLDSVSELRLHWGSSSPRSELDRAWIQTALSKALGLLG
eukprot:g2889.t1